MTCICSHCRLKSCSGKVSTTHLVRTYPILNAFDAKFGAVFVVRRWYINSIFHSGGECAVCVFLLKLPLSPAVFVQNLI